MAAKFAPDARLAFQNRALRRRRAEVRLWNLASIVLPGNRNRLRQTISISSGLHSQNWSQVTGQDEKIECAKCFAAAKWLRIIIQALTARTTFPTSTTLYMNLH